MSSEAAKLLRTQIQARMIRQNIQGKAPSFAHCKLAVEVLAEAVEMNTEVIHTLLQMVPLPQFPKGDPRQLEIAGLEQPTTKE